MRAQQEPALHLLIHPPREVGSPGIIDRDYDDAAQRTAEKRHHPLGRVRSPQQDALAFSDGALLQFAGKLECGLGHLTVAPANGAVSPMLNIGAPSASSQKVFEVFDYRAALHAYDGIALRGAVTATADGTTPTFAARSWGRSSITSSETRPRTGAWAGYALSPHATDAETRGPPWAGSPLCQLPPPVRLPSERETRFLSLQRLTP